MMPEDEWYRLKQQLRDSDFSTKQIDNVFFKRLLTVLNDNEAKMGDILASYRDALMASPKNVLKPTLTCKILPEDDLSQLQWWGLHHDSLTMQVSLDKSNPLYVESSNGPIDTSAIYQSQLRRKIQKFPMDPMLRSVLGKDNYSEFNGAGQRDAMRVVLSDEDGKTFLVNLPTGVGKTLLIEALDALAPKSSFTLVIVPTVGLAIDQSRRIFHHYSQTGTDHGGDYCLYSDTDTQERYDIYERIAKGEQKILFCSPEAALTSLKAPILESAKRGYLDNIFIDEAHLVDQWGAHFRPHFQAMAALVKSARNYAHQKNKNIRCVLLSATYTTKTLNVLKSLFSDDSISFVSIHGGFLRPEIQYAVSQVSENEHEDEVLRAVKSLPKPMILYTTKVEDANKIYSAIKEKLTIRRIGLFTGSTLDSERTRVLHKWTADEIDLVIATSAFGVGINKPNVRSVIHATVPENLDRFYQEVGRSGRDGYASQSLVLFHAAQLNMAESINHQKLISVSLGRERWTHMWGHGDSKSLGRRLIKLNILRSDLQWLSKENELWNWRTVMLLQRANAVSVELEDDSSYSRTSEQSEDEKPDRSVGLLVTTLKDEHLEESFWNKFVSNHRKYEMHAQNKGYETLKTWLLNPNEIPLCELLVDYYTIHDAQPEKVCGGCPNCRSTHKDNSILPTVGMVSHIDGLIHKPKLPDLGITDFPAIHAYYEDGSSEEVNWLDSMIDLISRLISSNVIRAIRSNKKTLERIETKLPKGLRKYWIGLSLDENNSDLPFTELVIVPPDSSRLPRLTLITNPMIFLAPKHIKSNDHQFRYWWQDDAQVVHLNTLIERLEHVDYQ